jgi:hypothetical protein
MKNQQARLQWLFQKFPMNNLTYEQYLQCQTGEIHDRYRTGLKTLCLSKKHSPAATHNPWSIQQKRTLIYTYWSKFRWRVAVNCHWIKTYIRQKEDGCSKQNNNTMINMVGLSLDRFMVFPWPTAPARAFLLECLKKSQSGYDAQ